MTRILVVEDEYFVADDLSRALSRAGMEVVGPVSEAGAALALLDRHGNIDGAVLDINLKGELIYPVADVLSARGVPFVFATGYDRTALPARFDGLPRWEKPFDVQQVVAAIGAMVR
jgi:CheY-like chemotaxis protein